jgi:hypothetical protein
MIALFTDRSRAVSIVGDLLETEADQQPLRFWLSVGRILFSLTWRRVVAYTAAYCVALFLAREVIALVFEIHPVHALPGNSELLHIAQWFWLVSCIGASYSAVRYGLRDRFVQLALGICGLITVATLYWWMPIVTVPCLALAFSIVIGSVRSAQQIRALVALVFALAIGFGGSHFALYLDLTVRGLFFYPMTHYIEVFFRFLTVWSMTASCALTHHILLLPEPQSSEI